MTSFFSSKNIPSPNDCAGGADGAKKRMRWKETILKVFSFKTQKKQFTVPNNQKHSHNLVREVNKFGLITVSNP